MPHGKTDIELSAIVGSAMNMLAVTNGAPHRNWRHKEAGARVVLYTDLPVVLSDDDYAAYVVFGNEEAFMSRAYVTLPLMEFLDRYEPIEQVSLWQVAERHE